MLQESGPPWTHGSQLCNEKVTCNFCRRGVVEFGVGAGGSCRQVSIEGNAAKMFSNPAACHLVSE